MRRVPCGRTDRETDMTKLIAAFCSLANSLKNALNTHEVRQTVYKLIEQVIFVLCIYIYI